MKAPSQSNVTAWLSLSPFPSATLDSSEHDAPLFFESDLRLVDGELGGEVSI
jgi:hypothetical protein